MNAICIRYFSRELSFIIIYLAEFDRLFLALSKVNQKVFFSKAVAKSVISLITVLVLVNFLLSPKCNEYS